MRRSVARSIDAMTAASSQAGTKMAMKPGWSGRAMFAGEGARVAAVDGRRAPQPAGEIDQVDGQIVGGEQQEADAANKASSAAMRVKISTASMSVAAPLMRRGGLE